MAAAAEKKRKTRVKAVPIPGEPRSTVLLVKGAEKSSLSVSPARLEDGKDADSPKTTIYALRIRSYADGTSSKKAKMVVEEYQSHDLAIARMDGLVKQALTEDWKRKTDKLTAEELLGFGRAVPVPAVPA